MKVAATIVLSALVMALLLVTISGAAPSSRTVYADNYQFSPKRVSIRRGGSVRWVFREGTHNVVGRGWGQKTPKSSGKYRKRFRQAGRFPYVCTLHPGMSGVVRVR